MQSVSYFVDVTNGVRLKSMKKFRFRNSIFKFQLLKYKLMTLIEILSTAGFIANRNFFHEEYWTRFFLTKNKLRSFWRSSISRELYILFLNGYYNQVIDLSKEIDVSKLSPMDLKIVSKSYLMLEQFNEHNKINLQIFEMRLNLSLSDIIKQFLVSNKPKIEHRYSTQQYGGMGNLGIITHLINGSPKYITKIKDMSNQKSNLHIEEFFYTQLLKDYPILKQYTPDFLDYKDFKKEKISAITIQYIAGRHPGIEDLDLLFDLQVNLLELNVSRYVNKPVREISIRNKLLYSTKSYWQLVIGKIEQKLNEHPNYSFEDELKWLRHCFLTKNIRKRMSNVELYALQHDDFGAGNIIINEKTNSAIAIDWGGIGISLYGTDLVHFLLAQGVPLKDICLKVINPLCMKRPHLKKELGTALILVALLKKVGPKIEILDFIEDFNQAIIYLRTLYNE